MIITTYNSRQHIERALESLRGRSSDDSPAEVIVVDNDSEDGTADVAEGFGVRVIRNSSNLGLARANNIGAAASCSRSLFFVNPDVLILPGCLKTLREFSQEHQDACLLGPAMLSTEETGGEMLSSARTFPTLLDILLRRTCLGRLRMAGGRMERHLRSARTDEPSVVDWLSGAAIWLTPVGREEVGLMSERYFLYFEDVDWAWRAHSAGMGVWFVPAARILHSCRRESAVGFGPALWQHLRSMLIFYSTHPSALTGNRPRKRR